MDANPDAAIIATLLSWALPLAGGVAVLFLLTRYVRILGSREIGVVEKRFVGSKLAAGRAFATGGEQGIQARYRLGTFLLLWPIERLVRREDFLNVAADQLGLVEATDGDSLPAGRVFAEDKAGARHNSFQDPQAFLTEGGIRGAQLRYITPGQYKIHPDLFRVTLVKRTVVPQGHIGLVVARDGAPLAEGQLLGRRVDGHNNFQNAETFIKSGGQRGPQVDFLRPGEYNIHTGVFHVGVVPFTVVENGQIGVVEAKAGRPMAKDDVVAVTPDMDLHQSFQDGHLFLEVGGIRGPQEAVLRPGQYYINTFLFDVERKDITRIKQGEVGVLVSHVGKDPAEQLFEGAETGGTAPISRSATDPEDGRVDRARQRYVAPTGYRGIQPHVLGPGNYNINPRAQTVLPVSTTTRSVEWSDKESPGEHSDFNPFSVVSQDGFEMKVEVRCQYRILPENAPFVVAKLGSVEELEKNVIHPQIDGIFRAQVSKAPAIRYQQNRAEEQREAEEAVRKDLSQYRVEVVSVMICNIVLPDKLMHITQDRNLAQQSEAMFEAQKAAEQKRIAFEQTRAQADQQRNIIEAEAGIDIARHRAAQAMATAEGEAQRIRITAEAQAAQIKQLGDAEAAVIEAKGAAQATAYQAQGQSLSPQGLTAVEVMKLVAAGSVKITPDIVAGVASGAGGSALADALLAMLVQGQLRETRPAATTGGNA